MLESGSIDLRSHWALLDFITDIAEVARVAAPLADLIVSSIGGIVAMPLTWWAADAYANVNGQIQGGADAIQDMVRPI
jgi:hypothetical protein